MTRDVPRGRSWSGIRRSSGDRERGREVTSIACCHGVAGPDCLPISRCSVDSGASEIFAPTDNFSRGFRENVVPRERHGRLRIIDGDRPEMRGCARAVEAPRSCSIRPRRITQWREAAPGEGGAD